MKRIIEIPDKVVEAIQNGEDYRYDIHTAIAQSTPYNPSGDAISREALIREIGRTDEWYKGRSICDIIDNAPPVPQVTVFTETADEKAIADLKAELQNVIEARPKGEWARHDEWRGGEYIGGFYHVNCPCEDGYYSKWRTNFCPNCGLPMKKGGAE